MIIDFNENSIWQIDEFYGMSEEFFSRGYEATELEHFNSVVCLRRQTPEWWSRLEGYGKKINKLHYPVPSSKEPGCLEALVILVGEVLPKLAAPVAIFCKEGRNRTGMILSILHFRHEKELIDSIKFYQKISSPKTRSIEMDLVKAAIIRSYR